MNIFLNVPTFWKVWTFMLYKVACFKDFVDILKIYDLIRDILA